MNTLYTKSNNTLAETLSHAVFTTYGLENYKESRKKFRFDALPKNVLFIYPRYFETVYGLSFHQILFWAQNSFLLYIENDFPLMLSLSMSPSQAAQYINSEDYIKYWVTNYYHYRISGNNNWNLVQLEGGEIVLVISFSESCLIYVMSAQYILWIEDLDEDHEN